MPSDYNLYKSIQRPDKMIENYIYLYHVDKFIVLPTYPESIQETLNSTFTETAILSRSAPIQTYASSGPRTVNISLQLHRDMMTQINYGVSNIKLGIGDDYVDTIINELQAVALPKYMAAQKVVAAYRCGVPAVCFAVAGGRFRVRAAPDRYRGRCLHGPFPLCRRARTHRVGICASAFDGGYAA